MKILHTSDLHLGKRLEGVLRLGEQRDGLAEIARLARQEKVDAVLIAGDIFDTKYPVPEAEELFYEFCGDLKNRDILLIAISGNHDESVRLSAARTLAKTLGCFFVGTNNLFDLSATISNIEAIGGESGLKIKKGEETLNIITLPFFTRTFLASIGLEHDSYEENLKELIERGEWVFEDNEKALNVFMGHIFITGSVLTGDESELGTLVEVSRDILPCCHYSALGHIHKRASVSKSKNAYYSGSILQYKFDESPIKGCNIVERVGEETKVSFMPFSFGKKLASAKADNIEEARLALEENENAFIELKYYGAPLSVSELKELKKHPCLIKITNCFIEENVESKSLREGLSDSELFSEFYEMRNGKKPTKEEMDLYLKVLANENVLED